MCPKIGDPPVKNKTTKDTTTMVGFPLDAPLNRPKDGTLRFLLTRPDASDRSLSSQATMAPAQRDEAEMMRSACAIGMLGYASLTPSVSGL